MFNDRRYFALGHFGRTGFTKRLSDQQGRVRKTFRKLRKAGGRAFAGAVKNRAEHGEGGLFGFGADDFIEGMAADSDEKTGRDDAA